MVSLAFFLRRKFTTTNKTSNTICMVFSVYGKKLNSLPNSGVHLVTGDLKMEAQTCSAGTFALSHTTRQTSEKPNLWDVPLVDRDPRNGSPKLAYAGRSTCHTDPGKWKPHMNGPPNILLYAKSRNYSLQVVNYF